MNEFRSWLRDLGDPGWGGWGLMLGYLVAAGLCGAAARRAMRAPSGNATVLWTVATGLMALLGINKQLDLHLLAWLLLRRLAHAQGWYDHRRAVAAAVAGITVAGGLTVLAGLLRGGVGAGRSGRLVVAGFLALLAYAVVREYTFGKLDTVLGTRVAHHSFRAFEAAGIALVCAGALTAHRRPPT